MGAATGDVRRRRVVAAALLVAILATVAAVGGPVRAAAGAEEPVRYRDEVFGSVSVERGLVFKTAPDHRGVEVALALDVYQPVGDTEARRPLIVWIHGGGFTGGVRDDGRSVEMATAYARRGFVVASIDYRVNPTITSDLTRILSDQELLDTVLAANDDARDAVVWLKDQADRFGVDARAVVPAGYSAGAILALMAAYWPNRLLPGWDTDPRRVPAAISVSGTMFGLFVEDGDPPAYLASGDRDTRVPYATARTFCEAVRGIGQRCDFFTMPGTGHDPTAFHETIREDSAAFVFDEVLAPLGYLAVPLPTTTTTTSTTTTSTSTTTTTVAPPGPDPAPAADAPTTTSISPSRARLDPASPAAPADAAPPVAVAAPARAVAAAPTLTG